MGKPKLVEVVLSRAELTLLLNSLAAHASEGWYLGSDVPGKTAEEGTALAKRISFWLDLPFREERWPK